MSKKQREKVEDEVRFHRAQMLAQNDSAPDSSVYEQTPSSSDQFHHNNNNNNNYNNGGFVIHLLVLYHFKLQFYFQSIGNFLSFLTVFNS